MQHIAKTGCEPTNPPSRIHQQVHHPQTSTWLAVAAVTDLDITAHLAGDAEIEVAAQTFMTLTMMGSSQLPGEWVRPIVIQRMKTFARALIVPLISTEASMPLVQPLTCIDIETIKTTHISIEFETILTTLAIIKIIETIMTTLGIIETIVATLVIIIIETIVTTQIIIKTTVATIVIIIETLMATLRVIETILTTHMCTLSGQTSTLTHASGTIPYANSGQTQQAPDSYSDLPKSHHGINRRRLV